MWLRLDGDTERRILPGTYVVQRGTLHRRENRSNRSATMLFVLVGDRPTPRSDPLAFCPAVEPVGEGV
ncbi:hypothetical protein RERY_29650 [Rhodococcus erythropolis]|nr:hypothetical protein RERY_29650 [Rhodococcus erythropolis]